MSALDLKPMTPSPLPRGFTLLELTVVLVIGAVMTALAADAFAGYQSRAAARRAAEIFAGDLRSARSAAKAGQESVVVRFYEDSHWYTVTTEGGRELARRMYTSGRDIRLDSIDLELAGDSVLFSQRGVADLSQTMSGVGAASFWAGPNVWEVEFNALGNSRVGER